MMFFTMFTVAHFLLFAWRPPPGQLGNRTDGGFIAQQGKVSYDFVDTPTAIAGFPTDGGA